MSVPVDLRNSDMYVAIVTYHAPQIKYSSSIMTESLAKTEGFMRIGLRREIYRTDSAVNESHLHKIRLKS